MIRKEVTNAAPATSPCLRTDTCCACSWRAGSDCPPCAGQQFLLDTGTLWVLGYYRDIPAVKIWKGPLND